jgi:hypothetical protein
MLFANSCAQRSFDINGPQSLQAEEAFQALMSIFDTDNRNPRLRTYLPCCIKFNLLKKGSQSAPGFSEFVITA